MKTASVNVTMRMEKELKEEVNNEINHFGYKVVHRLEPIDS